MVNKAVCGQEGFLDVQAYRRLDKPCQDIPVGFPALLPIHRIQWNKECGERGVNDV